MKASKRKSKKNNMYHGEPRHIRRRAQKKEEKGKKNGKKNIYHGEQDESKRSSQKNKKNKESKEGRK